VDTNLYTFLICTETQLLLVGLILLTHWCDTLLLSVFL